MAIPERAGGLEASDTYEVEEMDRGFRRTRVAAEAQRATVTRTAETSTQLSASDFVSAAVILTVAMLILPMGWIFGLFLSIPRFLR